MFNSEILSLIKKQKNLELLFSSNDEIHIAKKCSQYVWIVNSGYLNEYVITRYKKFVTCRDDVKINMLGRLQDIKFVIAMILGSDE